MMCWYLQVLFFFWKFFGHAGFVLGENGKYVYFHILHFKNFIPNISLSKEKTPVACTPYLVTYLLRIEQYLEEKAFFIFLFLSVMQGDKDNDSCIGIIETRALRGFTKT